MHDAPMNRDALIDLAAALRWAARLDMHESIANHFSLAVSDDGFKFLLNPVGRHFSRMRASDLRLLDAHEAPALGPQALKDILDQEEPDYKT